MKFIIPSQLFLEDHKSHKNHQPADMAVNVFETSDQTHGPEMWHLGITGPTH